MMNLRECHIQQYYVKRKVIMSEKNALNCIKKCCASHILDIRINYLIEKLIKKFY